MEGSEADLRFIIKDDSNEKAVPAEVETPDQAKTLTLKTKKPGVIYLNYIPRHMNVKLVREYFSDFGEVRRLFLKPEQSKKGGKPSKFFCEGWVEFASRKKARQVAECLNGAQVGGRKHTPYYDALWSIKYLKKFQWSQLNEKQAYRRAQKGLRMRAEIAQAKREVNFYTQGAERQKRMKKKKDSDDATESETHTVQAYKNAKTNISRIEPCNEKAVSVMKNILI